MNNFFPLPKRLSRRLNLFLFLGLTLALNIEASNLTLGLGAGFRKINDAYLKKVYGNGFVFIPYFQIQLSKLISAELAYEGGYKKEAPIGIYQEPSVLKISGIELSSRLHYPFKIFSPYLKLGAGYYFYRQDIESPYVRSKVNHKHISSHAGFGCQLMIKPKLCLQAEMKYAFLKVKPFEMTVDLGGLRYILSAGFKF